MTLITVSGALMTAAALALAEGPKPPTPRIILHLVKAGDSDATLTVENVGKAKTSVEARTFAVVTIGDGQAARSYWARLRIPGVPQPGLGLELQPRAKAVSTLRLAELQWSEDRSGISPEQPLSRAIPPGSHRVQVQVEDETHGWWRSNELTVLIGSSGTVKYR